MNARNIAALAVTASFLTASLVVFNLSANAADGPLSHFAGNWSGAGKITVKDGSSERIRCRSSNTSKGNSLVLSLRCASDSYKFELASDIAYDGGNISGSWNETTRGVIGTIAGKANAGNIQAAATAVGFSAGLSIRSSSSSLSVSIRSPGSEISEVSVSMVRGGR